MGSYRHRDGDNTRESAHRQDRKRRRQGGQQSTAGRGRDEDGPLRWLRWLSCLRVTMEATTLVSVPVRYVVDSVVPTLPRAEL